jgi:iron complex outermembrane receptor protein
MPHEMKLRFGAAITVARPRLDDMGGGSSYTVTSDQTAPPTFNGTPYYWSRNGGGNPKLHPWKANTFDLSFEKYFGIKGYVSLAAYYKDLKTYIFNQSVVEDFSGVPVPPVVAGDPTTYNNADANRAGVSTVKTNGSGGYIQGAEFTASIPFSTFAESLDGFGFIASAAVNSSSIKINGKDTPVPGLSTHVFNSTLYYEKYGFSARVSNRYRGDFVGEVPAFDASLTLNNVKAESLLDAQVGYTFDKGALDGLSISLSGTNLTDEPFVLSNVGTDPYNLIKYQKYGAVYAFSLSYTF